MNPTFYGAQEQRTGGRGGTLRPRAALVAGNVNSSLCAPHASLRLMFGILIALFCLGILIVVFVITSISTLRWIVFGLTFTVLILQVLNFVAEYY
jgi:hypothetical protein